MKMEMYNRATTWHSLFGDQQIEMVRCLAMGNRE